MGLYLNPNADAFLMGINSQIYVDKSQMVMELNKLVGTQSNFVCLSRPRRFGKSMIGNLISAYYSKGCDTRDMFSQMKVGETEGFDKYLNKLNVIKLDMNGWYQKSINEDKVDILIKSVHSTLLKEFRAQFPNLTFEDGSSIATNILNVYGQTGEKFVIIIDEYDVLVREQVPEKLFKDYLSFLNELFKDTTLRPAIALAYLTGIMPIVRDKIQSKLNEFDEYTMLDAAQLAPYVGFTKEEVKNLCKEYGRDYAEYEHWYDGYKLDDEVSLLNPQSVVTSILRKKMDSFWSATGSFEALQDYILMDFNGIRQDVINMISGASVPVNV
ncbi:MAG: AAA family ATPase, partial [Paludibacteraceae bacterium]|nr:AAA family ATPase [Paludibacteraceae bacterium]